MNNLKIYTTEELVIAFQFYLKGPKENKQVRDMLKEISKELLSEERDEKSLVTIIDSLLEDFYVNWGE